MSLLKFLGNFPHTVLFMLVALLAFFTIGSDFLFIDDTILVVNNPQVHFSLKNLAAIFTKPLGQIYDAADYPLRFIYYRPALSLLYMLNNTVWGINPVGFHLSNLLLHLLTTILIYRTGLLLFARNSGISLLAAAIFCVHPVHNELVSRVAMNENLLGIFMAASLYFYLQERRPLSLVAFTLALLTKESAVMLPFVLLFFELRKQRLREALRFLWPYVAVTAVYLLIRLAVVGIPDEAEFSTNLLEPLLAACSALASYLRLLVVPYPLNIYYPVWNYVSPLQSDLLVSVAICLLLGYTLWKMRAETLLFPLLLGTVVMLAPVVIKSNKMILGLEMGFIAERQLYVPAILFSLLIAAVLCKYADLSAGRRVTVACMLAIPLLAYATIAASASWENNSALSSRFIKDFPDSAIAHRKRGLFLLQQGDADGALIEFKAAFPAVKADPSAGSKGVADGSSAGKFKSLNSLIDKYSLEAYQPVYADLHYFIGQAYLAKDDPETAMRKFRTSLVLQPHSVDARTALAGIYLKKRQFRDASREYRLVLKDIDAIRRP